MKVFISMPMSGKTKETIKTRRAEIEKLLHIRFPNQEIEIINSIWEGEHKSPVWCLGHSIMSMEEADLVVFDTGWRKARGCRIENSVCASYGFKIMEL